MWITHYLLGMRFLSRNWYVVITWNVFFIGTCLNHIIVAFRWMLIDTYNIIHALHGPLLTLIIGRPHSISDTVVNAYISLNMHHLFSIALKHFVVCTWRGNIMPTRAVNFGLNFKIFTTQDKFFFFSPFHRNAINYQ